MLLDVLFFFLFDNGLRIFTGEQEKKISSLLRDEDITRHLSINDR